jgi:hypothetical protein
VNDALAASAEATDATLSHKEYFQSRLFSRVLFAAIEALAVINSALRMFRLFG